MRKVVMFRGKAVAVVWTCPTSEPPADAAERMTGVRRGTVVAKPAAESFERYVARVAAAERCSAELRRTLAGDASRGRTDPGPAPRTSNRVRCRTISALTMKYAAPLRDCVKINGGRVYFTPIGIRRYRERFARAVSTSLRL